MGARRPGFIRALVLLILWPAGALASPLQVSTVTRVDDAGNVRVLLNLQNTGEVPVLEIHPMFHFHHTQSMMPGIVRLDPGQAITLENNDHPPVVLSGRYPLHVMVKYRLGQDAPSTVLHTDSFFFREPVVSVVGGEIESSSAENRSLLKVLLKNTSLSLKNVRLMLVLPPGLEAENFGNMMGMTLRGGEQKSFTIAVKRVSGEGEASFPVRMMIEYGEMLKHYTAEIRGKILFHSLWDRERILPHILVLSLLGLFIFLYYRKNWRASSLS